MSKANRPRYCGTITKPTKAGCWIVRSKWRRGGKTIERDKQTLDSQQTAAEYADELEQRHAPKKEKIRMVVNVTHTKEMNHDPTI